MTVRLDSHTLRRVSVLGHLDPRTVVAYLDGRPLRPLTVARVEDALRDAGLQHLVAPRTRPVASRSPRPTSERPSAIANAPSEAQEGAQR